MLLQVVVQVQELSVIEVLVLVVILLANSLLYLSATCLAANASVAFSEEVAVGVAVRQRQSEIDKDVHDGKDNQDVEPLLNELQGALHVLEHLMQIGITASDRQDQVQLQDYVNSLFMVPCGMRVRVLREVSNGGQLDDVHDLVYQRPRKAEAFMLAGPDLLIEHLFVHLSVSAAQAVGLDHRDEDEEVQNEAGHDYLEHGGNHENFSHLHELSHSLQNLKHIVLGQSDVIAVTLPFEVPRNHESDIEVQWVLALF